MTTPTSPWSGDDGTADPVTPRDGDTQAIPSAAETQPIASEPEPAQATAFEPEPEPTAWAHDTTQSEATAAPTPGTPAAPAAAAWTEPAPLEPRRGPYAPAIVLGLLGILMATALLLVSMGGVRINLVRSAPWVMLGSGALLIGVGALSRARQ